MSFSETSVERVEVSAYTIPTDAPEADGTFQWKSTTLVLCEIHAADRIGIGYTYGSKTTASLADELANKCLLGRPAARYSRITRVYVRAGAQRRKPRHCVYGHLGARCGAVGSKGKAIGLFRRRSAGHRPAERSCIRQRRLHDLQQSATGRTTVRLGWERLKSVKMKIGAEPKADLERVRVAREAIGANVELFVDANGAYDTRQAISFAQRFAEYDVTWFEEPVSSDQLSDLRRVRDQAPRRDGDRCGRIWLRPLLLPANARGGSGRRIAIGRDTLQGIHRISARICDCGELRLPHLRPLCSVASHACGVCHSEVPTRRILP